MELVQKAVGSVLVIKIIGSRLDARSAPGFKDQLGEIVAGGQRRIVLDLSEVTFVDSSGLGAMASILKALEGSGGLAVCGARDAVRTVFKLTRLDKVLRLCGGEAEAVAALSG